MNDTTSKKPLTDTVESDKVRPISPEAANTQSDSLSQESQDQVSDLTAQLALAQNAVLRSQADYQNLQRRTQDEKSRWLKLAAQDLIKDLVEPLDHLSMAAEQLKDPGLNMTITQLWQTLKDHGLQEIEPLGEVFDVSKMEVVEQKGEGETVVAVVKRGYTLDGHVIQHAKVVVGDDNNSKNK